MKDAARTAIKSQRMFNLMHLDSAVGESLVLELQCLYAPSRCSRPLTCADL
jgi:hypothetical protein